MTYYEIATDAHGRIDLRTGELAQLVRARRVRVSAGAGARRTGSPSSRSSCCDETSRKGPNEMVSEPIPDRMLKLLKQLGDHGVTPDDSRRAA
jgi:hypothetical protein